MSKEMKELKLVLNTPVLGLAAPIKSGALQLGYDCYLCDLKAMNQSGIYNHLEQIHKVKRIFDAIPVEEDNVNIERRSVVTTKETITVEPTGNNIEITTTDATEAPLEFAHFCEKCKKGFTHKANLHKHKKEHIEAAKPNSNVQVVEKTKEPLNKHNNFKFSGIISCDKCEAVFISEPLLKEHNGKYHKQCQETEADAHEPVHQVTQLHCALYEEPMCQFQCTTLRELNSHIEKNT
jgi:hypothetical protein